MWLSIRADGGILPDRQQPAALMIRFGVGVQVTRTVQIVEIDEDFFVGDGGRGGRKLISSFR